MSVSLLHSAAPELCETILAQRDTARLNDPIVTLQELQVLRLPATATARSHDWLKRLLKNLSARDSTIGANANSPGPQALAATVQGAMAGQQPTSVVPSAEHTPAQGVVKTWHHGALELAAVCVNCDDVIEWQGDRFVALRRDFGPEPGRLMVWSTAGKMETALTLPKDAYAIEKLSNGRFLVSCAEEISVWTTVEVAAPAQSPILGAKTWTDGAGASSRGIQCVQIAKIDLPGFKLANMVPLVDGRVLLETQYNGAVHVLSVAGEIERSFTTDDGKIYALPDGTVAKSSNGQIDIVDIDTRELVVTLTGHQGYARDVKRSGDRYAASINEEVRVWAEDGETVGVHDFKEPIQLRCMLSDGHIGVSTRFYGVKLWNPSADTLVTLPEAHEIRELADGRVVTRKDGWIRFWDAKPTKV